LNPFLDFPIIKVSTLACYTTQLGYCSIACLRTRVQMTYSTFSFEPRMIWLQPQIRKLRLQLPQTSFQILDNSVMICALRYSRFYSASLPSMKVGSTDKKTKVGSFLHRSEMKWNFDLWSKECDWSDRKLVLFTAKPVVSCFHGPEKNSSGLFC
jgi:hypothetical protein